MFIQAHKQNCNFHAGINKVFLSYFMSDTQDLTNTINSTLLHFTCLYTWVPCQWGLFVYE